MTQLLLAILAVAAAISAFFGFNELLQVASRRDATVWQQMSARIDVGLSLLVFATSAGLATLIDRQMRSIRELQRFRTLMEKLNVGSFDASVQRSDLPLSDSPDPHAPAKVETGGNLEMVKTFVFIVFLLSVLAILYVTQRSGV